MGCGASLPSTCLETLSEGPKFDTEFESWLISPSMMYCMIQHNASWSDYYCLIDTRSKTEFEKAHLSGAVCYSDIEEDLEAYCQEILVVLYDTKPDSDNYRKIMTKLHENGIEPVAIYILSTPLGTFKKRYPFVMSDFAATEGQFPGPIELIPRTKSTPAIYTLHRHQFSRCQALVAHLRCMALLNVSSKRLFVRTPGVALENVVFADDETPYDQAITALFQLAGKADVAGKSKNILIIDEGGNEYGAMLCAWYLVSRFGVDVETAIEHITNKSAEFDEWYMDILREWAESRPRENNAV